MIKIAFFDIDGTLIDMNKKKITEKMLETLKKLKENGIKICISTGRPPIAVPKFEGVEFDAYLTYNGSLCYSGDEIILSNSIATEDVQRVVRNTAEIGRPVALSTRNNVEANGNDQDLSDYFGICGQKVPQAEDFEKLQKETIYQMMVGCRESDYPQILKDVKTAQIVAWWDRAADIIPTGGGKGAGVAKILEYYHLDRSEAVAFGDGNNDIQMLQAVDHGIAMGNASDSVKEKASDVCGSVADDGIYYYCKEHGLI